MAIIDLEKIPFTDKTFVALILNAKGAGLEGWYHKSGCQDLRRNGLYSWIQQGIDEGNVEVIDFLEIMVSVVLQLHEDYPDAIPRPLQRPRKISQK